MKVGKKKPTLECIDCGEWSEWYMLKDDVWLSAVPDYSERVAHVPGVGTPHVYCCLTCVEGRLGRPLTLSDFSNAPVNSLLFRGFELGTQEVVGGKTS